MSYDNTEDQLNSTVKIAHDIDNDIIVKSLQRLQAPFINSLVISILYIISKFISVGI